ncbi:MAG: hypothetical protein IPG25_09325 [Proteobacteria bacterium]|nr:hypothetical protein [Pseudomonadota bacterium]
MALAEELSHSTSAAFIAKCDGKRDVIVYDYIDSSVPVLARADVNREKGDRALGYVTDVGR